VGPRAHIDVVEKRNILANPRNQTTSQWARITRKLAKIIKLLVLIEKQIFNKIKIKISIISITFN
jgi:hypothetical protein